MWHSYNAEATLWFHQELRKNCLDLSLYDAWALKISHKEGCNPLKDKAGDFLCFSNYLQIPCKDQKQKLIDSSKKVLPLHPKPDVVYSYYYVPQNSIVVKEKVKYGVSTCTWLGIVTLQLSSYKDPSLQCAIMDPTVCCDWLVLVLLMLHIQKRLGLMQRSWLGLVQTNVGYSLGSKCQIYEKKLTNVLPESQVT